jgi:SOS-response transcriptional repressor LexA
MTAKQRPLTPRQQEVLAFMREFFADNDQLPTLLAIARRFGWKSVNAAVVMTAILERKGFIEKNVLGKYRFSRPKVDGVAVASPEQAREPEEQVDHYRFVARPPFPSNPLRQP